MARQAATSALPAEEPLGVVDVVRLEALPRALGRRWPVGCGTRSGDPAAGSTAPGPPPPAPGRCRARRARTARSCRMRAQRLALGAGLVLRQREQLPAALAQRGAARTISCARGSTSRGRPAAQLGIEQAAPGRRGAARRGVRPRGARAATPRGRRRPARATGRGPAPAGTRPGRPRRASSSCTRPRRPRDSNRRASSSSRGTARRYPSRRRLDAPGRPEPCGAGPRTTGGSWRPKPAGGRPRRRRSARRRSPAAPAGWPGPGVRRGRGDRDVPSRRRSADRGLRSPRRHSPPAVGVASTRADTRWIPRMSLTCTGSGRTGWVGPAARRTVKGADLYEE